MIASARRTAAALLAPLLFLLGACGEEGRSEEAAGGSQPAESAWNPRELTEVAGSPVGTVRGIIQQRLEAGQPAPLDQSQWRRVQRMYARFGQGPLWFDAEGMDTDRVAALISALINAHQDALRLERYPLNELSRALVTAADAERPTPQQISDADVLLTSAYVALGEDLLTGQIDPKSVTENWHIDPQDEQVDSALTRVLRQEPLDRAIATMRPQDPDYAALQRALVKYRQIAERGGWTKVPTGKELKPGQTDSPQRLAALRQRLRAEGLLSDSAAAQPAGARAVYDERLAGAVAEFQLRHGIEGDSVLGTGTVATLNVPPGYRVGQIAANLERYRWLPRALGSRYILVNVPAFRLEAYDGGKKALEMKVIVGEEFEDRKTPVFSDSMEYVVFRPYWFVTDDIAEKELMPKIQADPGHLEQGRYELFQEGGKTRIRQKPGPKNSLGLVKFIFPNSYNIYLHDTPEDQLFDKDVRAFSHGCIRLEHPERLAMFALGWPEARVRQAMQRGADDQRVNLERKIPVYIAYFTAYERGGGVFFGNDLYDADDRLIRQVSSGAIPSPQALRALDSLRRFIRAS